MKRESASPGHDAGGPQAGNADPLAPSTLQRRARRRTRTRRAARARAGTEDAHVMSCALPRCGFTYPSRPPFTEATRVLPESRLGIRPRARGPLLGTRTISLLRDRRTAQSDLYRRRDSHWVRTVDVNAPPGHAFCSRPRIGCRTCVTMRESSFADGTSIASRRRAKRDERSACDGGCRRAGSRSCTEAMREQWFVPSASSRVARMSVEARSRIEVVLLIALADRL